MFYERYASLCANRGVSPSKVAFECGFNKGSVSVWKKKYQNGIDVRPSSEILIKIANYFNVSVDFLLEKETLKEDRLNEHINIIKIAGRDGSYEERALTDEQLELFKKMIDALPEATDL